MALLKKCQGKFQNIRFCLYVPINNILFLKALIINIMIKHKNLLKLLENPDIENSQFDENTNLDS